MLGKLQSLVTERHPSAECYSEAWRTFARRKARCGGGIAETSVIDAEMYKLKDYGG